MAVPPLAVALIALAVIVFVARPLDAPPKVGGADPDLGPTTADGQPSSPAESAAREATPREATSREAMTVTESPAPTTGRGVPSPPPEPEVGEVAERPERPAFTASSSTAPPTEPVLPRLQARLFEEASTARALASTQAP